MKSLRENIVVAYNFNEKSEKALNYAIKLAVFLKAKLHLVYVIEKLDFISEMFRTADDLARITESVEEKLKAKASAVSGNNDIEVFSHVEKGSVYNCIMQKADKLQARFIIQGNIAHSPTSDENLSTNIYKIVSESHVPVITVQGERDNMPKKIVVPLDLTRQTRMQVFNAIAFALNYNAQVYLVSGLIGGIKMSRSRIFNKLKKVRTTIRENGITCEAKLFPRSEQPVYEKVINYIKEIEADMVLVMTHREGVKNDNYIGAFSSRIINASNIPVLSLTYSASDPQGNALMEKIVDPVGVLFKQGFWNKIVNKQTESKLH